jgi:glucose 1-dehydrogenase
MTSLSLNDRIAIVTGAGSGIGLATAALFGRNGSAVVLVHHNQEDEVRDAIEAIVRAGGRAAAVNADVRNEDDVAQVFEVTQETFGTPNLLVNSAGVDAAGINVADMTMGHFENVLRTNLVGPFLFCRAFAQGLQKAAARGKIINISSVHEELPRAGAADYCASKGACVI